jgi:hypothetical protein
VRFFADQNVDNEVLAELRRRHHQAWSADQAGLATDLDDDLTAYVHDHQAVLLTHDKEFSRRRRKNVIGRHIWLDCDELVAAAIIVRYIDDFLPILEHHEHVWIRLARTAANGDRVRLDLFQPAVA